MSAVADAQQGTLQTARILKPGNEVELGTCKKTKTLLYMHRVKEDSKV